MRDDSHDVKSISSHPMPLVAPRLDAEAEAMGSLELPSHELCQRIYEELSDSSDRETWTALESEIPRLMYELVTRQVLSLLRHRTYDKRSIIQDAAWRALASLHRYDGHAKVSTWCWTVCWRTVRDHDRATARFGSLLRRWAVLAPPAEAASPEGGLLDEERSRVLQSTLARLGADERAVVVLYYFEDLPLDEVATILSDTRIVPVKTVQSRLSRARKKLHQMLRADAYFGDEACRSRRRP